MKFVRFVVKNKVNAVFQGIISICNHTALVPEKFLGENCGLMLKPVFK